MAMIRPKLCRQLRFSVRRQGEDGKLTPRQRQLLQVIDDAFRDVVLGDGVSLHETIVCDNCGSSEERRAAREPDEKVDWHKLIDDPDLLRMYGLGGPSFYDAIGLRFHLPAYLYLAVHGPKSDRAHGVLEAVVFQLTHFSQHNLKRLSILDQRQRSCIREVLKYLLEQPDYTDSTEIKRAIDDYWGRPPRAIDV